LFSARGRLGKKARGGNAFGREAHSRIGKDIFLDRREAKRAFLSKKEHHKAKISFLLASYFSYLNFPATQKKLFLTQIDRLITRAREHTKTKTTRRIDGEHSFSREFHITRFAITFIV
jgi:hypothetical protein